MQVPENKQKKSGGNAKKSNKGLIATLILLGVLLIAAIVTIIILVVSKKKEQDDNTTAWISEPTVGGTEEPTETKTTETTEATEEPTTQEAVPTEIRYENYYDSLADLRYEIESYYWQYGYSYLDEDIPPQRPVAFTDVTGDGIDEMIVMHATGNEAAVLDIYTINEDGIVTMLFRDNWDIQVAGGTVYYLFKTNSSDSLYAFSSISDEWMNGTVYEFVVNSDNMLTAKELATIAVGPNADYTETISQYTMDGAECTESEYESFFDGLRYDASEVVMYNCNYGNDENGVSVLLGFAEDIAISYKEAVSHVLVVDNPKENELPIAKPIDMMFSSGAGGWSTDIVLNPDGTFTGSYHDSNMGESGDGYESTIYYCSFEGRFTNIKKIDDYTYQMELTSMTNLNETEEESIEDGIRYVPSMPYGIEGGKTFEFYMPGKKTDSLPEMYISWVWGLEDAITMDSFGLYNVDMEQGFANY